MRGSTHAFRLRQQDAIYLVEPLVEVLQSCIDIRLQRIQVGQAVRELNLRSDQRGAALESPPKPLLCRRYRRPHPQRADFTLKIARQSLRVLAIRLHALPDILSIMRQTVRIDEIDWMSTCVSNLLRPVVGIGRVDGEILHRRSAVRGGDECDTSRYPARPEGGISPAHPGAFSHYDFGQGRTYREG